MNIASLINQALKEPMAVEGEYFSPHNFDAPEKLKGFISDATIAVFNFAVDCVDENDMAMATMLITQLRPALLSTARYEAVQEQMEYEFEDALLHLITSAQFSKSPQQEAVRDIIKATYLKELNSLQIYAYILDADKKFSSFSDEYVNAKNITPDKARAIAMLGLDQSPSGSGHAFLNDDSIFKKNVISDNFEPSKSDLIKMALLKTNSDSSDEHFSSDRDFRVLSKSIRDSASNYPHLNKIKSPFKRYFCFCIAQMSDDIDALTLNVTREIVAKIHEATSIDDVSENLKSLRTTQKTDEISKAIQHYITHNQDSLYIKRTKVNSDVHYLMTTLISAVLHNRAIAEAGVVKLNELLSNDDIKHAAMRNEMSRAVILKALSDAATNGMSYISYIDAPHLVDVLNACITRQDNKAFMSLTPHFIIDLLKRHKLTEPHLQEITNDEYFLERLNGFVYDGLKLYGEALHYAEKQSPDFFKSLGIIEELEEWKKPQHIKAIIQAKASAHARDLSLEFDKRMSDVENIPVDTSFMTGKAL